LKNSSNASSLKGSLYVSVLVQLMAWLLTIFDVPVVRQVFMFAYLTFFPGFVFVKLLKSEELDRLETLLFSVGFSVAFLMLVGLTMSEVGPLFGVIAPLSFFPLITAVNGLVLLSLAVAFLSNKKLTFWETRHSSLPFPAILSLALPILSISGTYLANLNGDSLILMLTLAAISLTLVLTLAYRKQLPLGYCTFVLSMIGIALLFQSSLISKYIITFGSDVPVEYFLAGTVQQNARWSSTFHYIGDMGFGRVNDMLSVTVLPVIYSNLLNVDLTFVFKVIAPLIFSLVPLGLYSIFRTYVGKTYAFASVFLFAAQSTFYTEMLGLNRQMTGELFLVLLLMVILSKKLGTLTRMLSFTIFGVALVVSHYALAEIFLAFMIFVLVYLAIRKYPQRNLTLAMVLLFFVTMFSWYLYTSGSAVFDSFIRFGEQIRSQLTEFLNPASRGQQVLTGIGVQTSPSIWNTASRGFAYLTQALIIIGFVGIITNRLKTKFDKEYVAFSIGAMGLLAALLIVPGLANTLNMTRFYHILLFFLAPFCILGTVMLIKTISKRENELAVTILILLVLIPYFLFQTGFVYEAAKSDSWSLPLSKYRMDPVRLYGALGYIDDYSVASANWLSASANVSGGHLYSDWSAIYTVLPIYGMVYRGDIKELTNTTVFNSNDITYLDYFSVNYENSSAPSLGHQLLSNINLIYSNGGSQIYSAP